MPISMQPLVDDKIALESRRCVRIINRDTGREFERDLDPKSGWAQLYYKAIKEPATQKADGTWKGYLREMEEAPAAVMNIIGDTGREQRAVYTQRELEGMARPHLQAIAQLYNLPDEPRNANLILRILDAQMNLIRRASLEELPKRPEPAFHADIPVVASPALPVRLDSATDFTDGSTPAETAGKTKKTGKE